MCTHAHAHACTRTHARTRTHTHAHTHDNGGGGGHGGGSGSGGYGGRGGGSASQSSRGRATVSQRGFPHVAHATVSIRGFPQVLLAVASSGRPAMPRDDGGRPSPPDIAACSVGRSCGTCLCVWAGGLTCDRRRGRSRRSFGWDRGGATPLPQGSDAALPYRPGRSWPARRPGRGLHEGEDSAAVARPVIGTSKET